jgi:RNA polymerase sigma-70 factor (ECF subfamily)
MRTLEKLRTGAVREPDRIASFVIGMARMMCREMSRGAWREQPLPAEPAGPAETPAPAPPEALAGEQLLRCMERLSERDRAVVVLTFYGEQSAGEIAATLAVTEGNVRIIRHRAIGRLRGCMGLSEEVPS